MLTLNVVITGDQMWSGIVRFLSQPSAINSVYVQTEHCLVNEEDRH